MKYILTSFLIAISLFQSCHLPEAENKKTETVFDPKFNLTPADTFYFKSFVDCSMGKTLYGVMMKT
jgi:hypothetical protein